MADFDQPERVVYKHTQRGPLCWVLVAFAAMSTLLTGLVHESPFARLLIVVPFLILLLAACFATLTVQVTAAEIDVRFGPLPLFQRRIAFTSVSEVEVARSGLIDGFGVHWIPGRGWIWNLWGFDCVALVVDGEPFRIGTNDPTGLAEAIRSSVPRSDLHQVADTRG